MKKDRYDIVIAVAAKCPKDMSRFRAGPEDWQDWKRACKKAKELLSVLEDEGLAACILVTTAFHKNGCEKSEAAMYKEALNSLGVTEEAGSLVIQEKGFHTGDQIHYAEAFARDHGAEVIIVSTILHFPHVWVRSRYKSRHKVAVGLPCLWESFKDPFMAVFALILENHYGLWVWFDEVTAARRQKGDW